MPQLRVALAQIDTTVGDLEGNAARALRAVGEAAAAGAHLVLLPEMTLTGYPAEDLVLRRSFVEAAEKAAHDFAGRLAIAGYGEIAVAVGTCSAAHDAPPAVGRPAGSPRNTLALCWRGEVATSYHKHHLPNYGVFDEARYFVPGTDLAVVRLHGIDVALTVCEDLWQEGGPIAVAGAADAGLVVVINASPFEQAKSGARLELAATRAHEAGAALAYVNQVGGQDELVFDGGSFVVDAAGELLTNGPRFVEHLLVADLELPAARSDFAGQVDAKDGTTMTITRTILSSDPLPAFPAQPFVTTPDLPVLQEVWEALVVGTRDYITKNGFASVALGLSGGIDSAVTATIAVDAIGADRVHTVALPSAYSSPHSLDDAADLAKRQGTQHRVIPIAPMVDAYQATLGGLTGLAEENLQARVRGTTLMALSNAEGHLILTTGNKSELATGFSTLYGDSAGGFAPLKDVPKTLVWELARWRNEVAAGRGETPPIPKESITKPPSAELAPGQLDSDRLPDYTELDAVLDDYVEGDKGRTELLLEHPPAIVDRVIRLVDLAEYKRRQYPPGPKITPKAFGRDRRLPITNRWRDLPREG
ncbi:MAG TPA: NAD+ synthase [Mycobacteriales bacterium]|nr:NAD+ synthase [Mycobacteriales bacterium]